MEKILKVDGLLYDEELYRFYDTVREAGLSVIDNWIERGLIDKEGVIILVEHLDKKVIDLLPCKKGKGVTKNIKQLNKEGLLSNRTYNAICRGLSYCTDLTNNEIYNLTVKDLFDLYPDYELCRFRNLGKKSFEELEGLL